MGAPSTAQPQPGPQRQTSQRPRPRAYGRGPYSRRVAISSSISALSLAEGLLSR